jgi:hypothetical protein
MRKYKNVEQDLARQDHLARDLELDRRYKAESEARLLEANRMEDERKKKHELDIKAHELRMKELEIEELRLRTQLKK